MSDARICVGAFAGAFGVQGEVRLKSFTADPEAIADYGPLHSEDGKTVWEIEITRAIKNGFAARVAGVRSKEEADTLRGVQLFADRDALPSLPDDEFYHTDLIGLAVFDTGGKALGTVMAVHNHGAGDLLEIGGPGLKTPVLLPFTREAVPTVDLTAGRVIADPPEGIFPE
ncbi:ribosome maturation factor RimM [Sinisalibacter aestuarii]|uniref:Ribosome maturation factor RimM n=1 Tax=Sinisalibacter aestuarii TaxID=2949426 RepID=A0ABQ5LWI6_9RHOB|nr:ribosome maturation factor RimM [Sinisalibacter aestuarii]GKY89345.1 ribosome maturation factor RimM [Sinisalibacter aestuarii]